MEKLYYFAPYVKTFRAAVESCTVGENQLYEAILNRTGFYPEGGGQPSDTGTLDGAVVLNVYERQGKVIHRIDKPLIPGTEVDGVIDWEKRFSNMQQHSGEHLLSGLVHKHYGYDNVGFHMGNDEVTVDFNGMLSAKEVEALEWEANRLIYDNVPVTEIYPAPEELHKLEYRSKKELNGPVRIIEIPGGDICACCGTHVMATGEIGIIKITGMIRYKGGVRISMLCGMRALRDYEKKQIAVIGISNLLSVKPELAADAAEKLKQDSAAKEVMLNQLYLKLFQEKANRLEESKERLLLFEEKLTPVLLRQFCTMLYEQKKGSAVMVCSGEEGRYQYALGSGFEDMGQLSKALNSRLNGKGGGSALMAQGTFMADKKNIETIWYGRL